MKTKTILQLLIVLNSFFIHSQSISTSPYSIYGLGSLYESDFGSTAAMGSGGIALPSSIFINNKNPASLAYIQPNSFLFDIGAKSLFSTFEDNTKKEKKNNFQFSHIAMAFPINSKSGVSISLQPYSSANYVISNYKLKIKNSNEDYILDADSKGGLNNFDLAYGYKISKKMTLGATSSLYFGNIEDNRDLTVTNSITTINKINYYSGIRFTIANQYKIDSTLVFGATLKMPTKIKASKTQSIVSINGSDSEVIKDDIESMGTNYYLPLEFGIGINKIFKNNLGIVFDFEKKLWKNTNQSSIYGEFTNQNKLSFGLSYFKNKGSNNFYDRVSYFSGINYDSGFLQINNQKINNIAFSLGIGIPLEQGNSMLNLSYSYGIKGKVSNELIKENYHKIGINLSLESIWFVKRKYY